MTESVDDIEGLGETALDLTALIELRDRRRLGRKLDTYFPDEGPLRRELYKKHMEFFAAGANYTQRCMMAANRTGKTEGAGGYELTLHLTGLYPAWWVGRRFNRPISAWCSGDFGETTRDIIQGKLLGPPSDKSQWGTGLIPRECIGKPTGKAGSVTNLLDTLSVLHYDAKGDYDGASLLGFKSYNQGRASFQGVEQDVIWLDEEPPEDVYGECLIRTMDTSGDRDGGSGMIMLTYTPIIGMSEVTLGFMPSDHRPGGERG